MQKLALSEILLRLLENMRKDIKTHFSMLLKTVLVVVIFLTGIQGV